MTHKRQPRSRLVVPVWAVSLVLLCPITGYAQHEDGGHSRANSDSTHGDGSNASYTLPNPDPYHGQIYCPVTGKKLGLTQPPVTVQTTIGEQKASFFGKMFGKKGTPGAVIYVCCPACAEKVRANPEAYLQEIIADKGCFTFTYGMAPSQRPPRASPGESTTIQASTR